jgi:hypothetical protein
VYTTLVIGKLNTTILERISEYQEIANGSFIRVLGSALKAAIACRATACAGMLAGKLHATKSPKFVPDPDFLRS